MADMTLSRLIKIPNQPNSAVCSNLQVIHHPAQIKNIGEFRLEQEYVEVNKDSLRGRVVSGNPFSIVSLPKP